MPKVTVYTVNKQEVFTHNWDSLPVRSFNVQDISPIYGTDELYVNTQVETYNLPIRKFVWGSFGQDGQRYGREVYAAFDNELLELIGCTHESERQFNYRISTLNMEVRDLHGKVNTLNDMSFWESVKWSFRKLKK